jgi:hypothetical protein
VDRGRLLLGDWNRVIRDPVDVLRLAFVVGTVVFAAMGRSTAVGLAITSGVLLFASTACATRTTAIRSRAPGRRGSRRSACRSTTASSRTGS